MAGRPKKIAIPEIKIIDSKDDFPLEFSRMQSQTVRILNKRTKTYFSIARHAAEKLLRGGDKNNFKIID